MKYKFFVYCPDDKQLIAKIIKAASKFAAGIYGNYTQVAFITYGQGTWKTQRGAHPHQGEVGKITKAKVAKIEMTCPAKKIQQIIKAIKKIHPWEQVDIEFIRLEE